MSSAKEDLLVAAVAMAVVYDVDRPVNPETMRAIGETVLDRALAFGRQKRAEIAKLDDEKTHSVEQARQFDATMNGSPSLEEPL